MRLHGFSRDPSRAERGAAAVEFALVSVVLLPLLFGLVDYGLWFSDSLGARSGVREGVRQAVVQAPVEGACSSGSVAGITYASDFDKMRCVVKQEIGAVSGPASVMIKTSSQGWVKGAPLIVCGVVKANGVTGLTPLPNNRLIYATTRMSIEVDETKPSGVGASGVSSTADPAPAGSGGWGWCQ
jgi:Flp pilus assembly protein TadG